MIVVTTHQHLTLQIPLLLGEVNFQVSSLRGSRANDGKEQTKHFKVYLLSGCEVLRVRSVESRCANTLLHKQGNICTKRGTDGQTEQRASNGRGRGGLGVRKGGSGDRRKGRRADGKREREEGRASERERAWAAGGPSKRHPARPTRLSLSRSLPSPPPSPPPDHSSPPRP